VLNFCSWHPTLYPVSLHLNLQTLLQVLEDFKVDDTELKAQEKALMKLTNSRMDYMASDTESSDDNYK
jgi:hypothetical protein